MQTQASLPPSPPPLARGLRVGRRVYLFEALLGGASVLVIGRGSRCQVRVRDRHISEMHAMVEVTGAGYLLRDSHSTNGTWVDAQRIRGIVLRVGMRVQLGETMLVAVDERGRAPVCGYRISDFTRQAASVYGSNVAAGEMIGRSHEFVRTMHLPPEKRRRT